MFSINQITFTSLLGGPFVGVYMISKNYGSSGLKVEEKRTKLIGSVLAAIALVIAIYLPEKASGIVYAGILVGIIRNIAKAKQSQLIETSLEEGTSRSTNWKCFLLGIFFLFITFFSLIVLIFALDPIGVLPEWYYEGG